MKKVCAWCKKVKSDDGKCGMISHGICEECHEKVLGQVEEREKRQVVSGLPLLVKKK